MNRGAAPPSVAEFGRRAALDWGTSRPYVHPYSYCASVIALFPPLQFCCGS